MEEVRNNPSDGNDGIVPAGQAIAEEIAESKGMEIEELEERTEKEVRKSRPRPIFDDPATRVAFIAGFSSMLVTLLNAILGR